MLVGKKKNVDFGEVGITTSLLDYHARYKYKKRLKDADLVDMFAIKGFSFIYKKDLVDLPFDPEYFIYAEDVYLGRLFKLRGYMNKYSIKSVAHHFHNVTKKSDKKINKRFLYLGERNRLMNLLIFYEVKTTIKIFPLILTGILLTNIFDPKKMPYRLKSYLWIVLNIKKILKKRAHIQKQRKVRDMDLISQMSCKFRQEAVFKKPLFRNVLTLINRIFCLYCRLIGLKTIEMR